MNKKKLISKMHFWFYIGLRYLGARKKEGKVNIIFLSLFLGITGGLTILIVVLGVMNGFQDNHISRRIEIGSYHITIAKKKYAYFNLSESRDIKRRLYDGIKEIEAVIPYADREVMMKVKEGYYNEEQVVKLRAVDPDEILKDSRFLKYFRLYYNDLELDEYSIILGEALFNRIWASYDSTVYLTPDISLRSFKSQGIPFRISDTFNTGSYDYDRFWGFISIYSLIPLAKRAEIDKIGIKLKNRNRQRAVIREIKRVLGNGYILQTAEEANRGYFAALKLEKIMILLLFLLIFLMVATNTFGTIKLTILEKSSDISILKSLGAMPEDIQVIFLIESLILGFGGSFFGVLFGSLIAYNIYNIFLFIEFVINKILLYISFVLENAVLGINFAPVKIYDLSIYYQGNFPVKIYLHEVIIICALIIAMTIMAAYLPVVNASKLKPNEIIKN